MANKKRWNKFSRWAAKQDPPTQKNVSGMIPKKDGGKQFGNLSITYEVELT